VKGTLWDFGLRGFGLALYPLNQTHQLSYGSNTQLLHHATTMDFHRPLRRSQFSSDLLVQHACNDQLHDFKLAWRQQIKQTPSLILLSTTPSLLYGSSQGPLDALEQLFVIEQANDKSIRFFHGSNYYPRPTESYETSVLVT
jgi:hypothetical protein